ncbi:MAG: hypothetical protein VX834_10725 [Myxococcota bacterium]|nr:hypothetical protein [Myxococcota bacterium]
MKILPFCFLLACLGCGSEEPQQPESHIDETATPHTSSDVPPSNESADETATETETDIPTDDPSNGSSPTSCGSPDQGLEPVDCTAFGDVNAMCVFSNHCYCNVDQGFVCEVDSDWGSNQECAPGSSCIPVDDES